MIVYIYTLSHPVTAEIRYVGQTNDPKRRLNRHIQNAKSFKDKRHVSNWIRSLNDHPIMTIVEECDYSQRNIAEQHWIDFYKKQSCDLCNSSKGGAGAGIGNKNCVGRVVSTETKQKISKANKGRKTTHGKGGKPGKSVYQYDLSGNLINTFKSIISASKALNICRRTIKNSLNNKNLKTHRSPYKWSYILLH